MRIIKNLNEGWSFAGPDGTTRELNLPHTWNDKDGQDGGNDYWRGTCQYRKAFSKPENLKDNQRVYLEFCGVNASACVWLNGRKAGQHDGGYSTFRINITDFIEQNNELIVEVDNGKNDYVYPQKADFTFYGGIYRDVNVIIVNEVHFDLDYYGGSGIKLTPQVTGNSGIIHAECFLGEKTVPDKDVCIQVLDADGMIVAEGSGKNCVVKIQNIHLWNGTLDPYLYTVRAILNVQGCISDQVEQRIGFRHFKVDSKRGFILNGREYPLRGVSRHQDWKDLGNAIQKKHHLRDMELIREVGANTIRLAHYQHDQYFYDLCDLYGLIVWAEIPYISEHMKNGRENTISQMKELIVQNYHHPSIMCWSISNEITISTKDKKDMLDNHRILNELCHRMDPYRLTTLACYAVCGPFNPVAHITDLVSWNLYLGWYVPGLFLNDLWIKFFHLCYPKRCLGYSEYGCEAMPNLHAARPVRGDNTEEYQTIYHEYLLRCFERNPYLWATHVWNMFDFAADARDQGGEPGMNHKGLVSFDRKVKKDSFYLYKAYWSKEPFVHVCSKRYVERVENEISVKVYSNLPEVTLYCDGEMIEKKQGNKIFIFHISISGEHCLEAVSGVWKDASRIKKVERPNPEYQFKKSRKSDNWV